MGKEANHGKDATLKQGYNNSINKNKDGKTRA